MAEEGRQCNTNWVLHNHVNEEEPEIIAQGIPKLFGPNGIKKQSSEIFETNINPFLVNARKEGEAQSVEQGNNHHCSVNENGGR